MSPLDKPLAPPREQAEAARRRRASVLAIIYGAGARGITVTGVVEATGMPRETINKILAKLRGAQAVVAVSHARNAAMRLYAPEFVPEDDAEPAQAEPGQVAAPRTYHPFADKSPWRLETATPVRPGAQDHLAVPSRRGDHRVQHRPMMCMGSSIGGGV